MSALGHRGRYSMPLHILVASWFKYCSCNRYLPFRLNTRCYVVNRVYLPRDICDFHGARRHTTWWSLSVKCISSKSLSQRRKYPNECSCNMNVNVRWQPYVVQLLIAVLTITISLLTNCLLVHSVLQLIRFVVTSSKNTNVLTSMFFI